MPKITGKRKVGTYLGVNEYQALCRIAANNNVSVSDYIHASLIDVIYEENYGVRRIGPQTDTPTREVREVSGATG